MNGRRLGLAGLVLVIIGVVLIGAGTVLASNTQTAGQGWFGGMMGGSGNGPGMMGGSGNGPGMMGGQGMMGSQGMMGGPAGNPWFNNGPQPGEQGFVAGTADAPRVIHVIAGPEYTFAPSTIEVQRGETVTFEVTTMGPVVHAFMVGPADAVAAAQKGTPEIADIGMMQTESLTYTFDGSGPYAFACHVAGHYEAGMRGTITVIG